MSSCKDIDCLIGSIVSGASVEQLQAASVGVDLNGVGTHGRTPLMAASADGQLLMAQELVRLGASVETAGIRGMTALHEAAAGGHADVAKYLLSVGGAVNAQTSDGITPLMCAAAWGNVEAAKALLEAGADRGITDLLGDTAADIALQKGEDEIAKYL